MLSLFSRAFEVAAFGVFLVGSATLAVTDVRTQLIPNRVLYPVAWVTGSALVCAAAAGGTWPRLTEALVSSAVAAAVFFVLYKVSGLGLGDVRLAGLLALFLGWFSPVTTFVGLVLGVMIGGLVAGVILALRRVDRKRTLPFGACLVIGCWVALLPTVRHAM